MNFPMFQDLGIHLINGQYLVQGRRVLPNSRGTFVIYPHETFLITSNQKRAHMKFARLERCTAKLGG